LRNKPQKNAKRSSLNVAVLFDFLGKNHMREMTLLKKLILFGQRICSYFGLNSKLSASITQSDVSMATEPLDSTATLPTPHSQEGKPDEVEIKPAVVSDVNSVLFGRFSDSDETEARATNDQNSVPQSFVQDFVACKKSAENNNADAQFTLGGMYENGQGVAANDVEAIRWYTKSAEQGDARAQFNLGFMYQHGQGSKQNAAKALRWYKRAAELGHLDAQYHLGAMYQNGDLVETDTVEAMLWYTEAAYQGHLRAQYSLAEMYYYGRGVVQNDTEALRWFKKAAEQGFAEAQYALGLLHQDNESEYYDQSLSVQWYAEAAAQNHAMAKNRLEQHR
jgi:hypothetical protein